jgi:hypothetical protein
VPPQLLFDPPDVGVNLRHDDDPWRVVEDSVDDTTDRATDANLAETFPSRREVCKEACADGSLKVVADRMADTRLDAYREATSQGSGDPCRHLEARVVSFGFDLRDDRL